MNAILSIDRNYAIGYKGELLFRCSDDLKRFKAITTGKTVILGRKTLYSFPGQKPLVNRNNIIMSRNPDLKVEGATVCKDVDQLLSLIKDIPSEDVFVIGGEEIYRLLLPFTDRIYITRFDDEKQADTFFVNIDELSEWKISEQSEEMKFGEIGYRYITYDKVKDGGY